MGTRRSATGKTRGGKQGRARSTGESDDELLSVLDQIGPDYLESGARVVGDRQVKRVLRYAPEIRKRIASGAALPRVKIRAEMMLSLVADFRAGTYRTVTYRSVALMVFALAYVIAPVDIVPDSLPIIGEVDDAIVVALCARMVRTELEAYAVWKLTKSKKRSRR